VSVNLVNTVVPPALPLAQEQYGRSYQDQLNNILRLYFNQLNAAVSLLQVPSVYLVADLPSAVDSGTGTRLFVTDATATTFASTVVGGGANKVPVYSNGTNWKVG